MLSTSLVWHPAPVATSTHVCDFRFQSRSEQSCRCRKHLSVPADTSRHVFH